MDQLELHNAFIHYGWECNETIDNETIDNEIIKKLVYIKKEKPFDEFIVQINNLYDISVTIPLLNSYFSYKKTFHNYNETNCFIYSHLYNYENK
jgi:hypothetical protein